MFAYPTISLPLRILLIDDNPDDRALVLRELTQEFPELEVQQIADAKGLGQALERSGFDLVITDYQLRWSDGLAVLRTVRAGRPDCPVIMFTGTGSEEIAVEAMKAGLNDYVLKSPKHYRRLPASVRGVLESAASLRRMQRAEAALRHSEEQLRQAQKMEAVGRLAGGVAHDFNNLLTVILGYNELLLQSLTADDLRRGNAEQVRQAAERAASLVRQLLTFSRRQVIAPIVLDLNALVLNLEKMLQRLIGEDLELVTDLAPGLKRVKADPMQLEQVIMNLAVNARDAMPRGGKLTIETANVELDEGYAGLHIPVQPGPYVMLMVSDTGCGMDAEAKAHLFEPFFTTKGQGKGTGLGLSTIYGIVRQNGGSIWLYSEPGLGTTFKIYLPQTEEEKSRPEGPRADPQVLHGTETILLVEDEPALRALMRDLLHQHGYTVLEARHGIEALVIEVQRTGPIHLLMTDMVLPQISGNILAERLCAKRLDLRVLFLSGYTEEVVLGHGVLEEGGAFLQKPFTSEALLLKVREVLDRALPDPPPSS